MSTLAKIRKYLETRCVNEGKNMPCVLELSNSHVATYYNLNRLSSKAKRSFASDLLINGGELGMALKGDKGSYFLIEISPVLD